jgi:hypothetical protein
MRLHVVVIKKHGENFTFNFTLPFTMNISLIRTPELGSAVFHICLILCDYVGGISIQIYISVA